MKGIDMRYLKSVFKRINGKTEQWNMADEQSPMDEAFRYDEAMRLSDQIRMEEKVTHIRKAKMCEEIKKLYLQ